MFLPYDHLTYFCIQHILFQSAKKRHIHPCLDTARLGHKSVSQSRYFKAVRRWFYCAASRCAKSGRVGNWAIDRGRERRESIPSKEMIEVNITQARSYLLHFANQGWQRVKGMQLITRQNLDTTFNLSWKFVVEMQKCSSNRHRLSLLSTL
jgi:hypothetical protein